MARKLPAIVFIAVLLAYTLFPGVEAVRQVDITHMPARVEHSSPAGVFEEETVDFEAGDALAASAQTAPPAASENSAVVRYTDAPALPDPTPAPTATPMPTPEATPIAKGMSGPDVAELQRKLTIWGFMLDKPDGVYGSGTEEAIKSLQTYLSALEAGTSSGATATFEDESVYGDGVVEALSGGVEHTPEPTPEPTPTPAPAYPATGIVDAKLMQTMDDGFPVYRETITSGSSGVDAHRVQRRLESLNYLYKGADGAFGEKTAAALNHFQKINKMPQTGIADRVTQELLFSDSAKQSDRPYHPYLLKVDVSEQRLYIYAWSNDGYKKLVKKVKCSTGLRKTPTPLGTYQDSTGPGARWHYFKKFSCWPSTHSTSRATSCSIRSSTTKASPLRDLCARWGAGHPTAASG